MIRSVIDRLLHAALILHMSVIIIDGAVGGLVLVLERW